MTMDTSLIIFRAISNFTQCLSEVFGKDNRSLKLYAHLISKTTVAHEKPIEKHIESFRKFCVSNREAIETKNIKKLQENQIIYSERVFINMKIIFNKADRETTETIWKHLLTISALVDPTGQAKKLLKEASQKGGSVGGEEANFLTDIINKVEENVNPNSNPMEAVSAIMKSGVFTDLVNTMGSGLENGDLDLGRLMGTVQQLVTNINPGENNANQGVNEGLDLVNNMINNLKVPQPGEIPRAQQTQGAPDMANIVNMMGPMLGALSGGANMPTGNQPVNAIERRIQAQVEKAKAEGTLSTVAETDVVQVNSDADQEPSFECVD